MPVEIKVEFSGKPIWWCPPAFTCEDIANWHNQGEEPFTSVYRLIRDLMLSGF